ncbi:phosphotransferase family protein [Pseudomonas borbori]|uniref:Predicted kinase, aminoglycoside phosphotransferase (APT) family n=1 Tax=Pseudomonas borbori TaxID=289003 RepID=A0A1I5XMN4_9PSED|nr:phosphotransferase family protein [Pseudomonas borbori]SFQ33208.1 Predicted kinase, aminoglycoside phosphotransferase (APT) family [Pseudomonas borbori]
MNDKNMPPVDWLEMLRRRFPTENEIDRILTRKMQRRAGPGYAPIPLETLVKGVESLLRTELDDNFEVSGAKWLSGGASKLQMSFMLTWQPSGAERVTLPMVLRMEPAESIVETSRLREFQLIKAMEGTVPVPIAYWHDADGKHLPYPALIYGFSEGITKPANAISGVSGLGTQLPADLRCKLAPQFVEHLAAIHTFDFSNKDLSAFDIPEVGTTQCAEWGVNWWERVWEEDSDEDVPLMRYCAAWLRENMPVLDHVGVVHSDYRLGNFLFTEHDAHITAWLDWELGRIGDRHQDIAWTTTKAFASLAEDGTTLLTCGLMPEADFIAAYERASGLKVNPKTVHWYKVYNDYMMVTLVMATGYRIARGGKTHQDVLVTWLMGIGYMLLDEMCTLIEEAP